MVVQIRYDMYKNQSKFKYKARNIYYSYKYKFRRLFRTTYWKLKNLKYNRWFIAILGLAIVFLCIAYYPSLVNAWPWGGKSYLKWMEIPIEAFGAMLVLIATFIKRYRTRVKVIKISILLALIIGGATYGYHHLDETGKIDDWIERSSSDETLSGSIKQIMPSITDTVDELRTVAANKLGDISDSVSDALDDDKVWIDGGYLVGADGNPIKLKNNSAAGNPSWSELTNFLARDNTDKRRYSFGSFVCADFAEMLHNNAEAEGLRCAYVCVDLSQGGHALNAFETTDRGLVFIDCTNSITSSPGSADKIVDVKEGKAYIPESIFPTPGWYSTWNSMGTVTEIETIKW